MLANSEVSTANSLHFVCKFRSQLSLDLQFLCSSRHRSRRPGDEILENPVADLERPLVGELARKVFVRIVAISHLSDQTRPGLAEVSWRQGVKDQLTSRFAGLRVRPAHRDYWRAEPYPEEWLLIEWPKKRE